MSNKFSIAHSFDSVSELVAHARRVESECGIFENAKIGALDRVPRAWICSDRPYVNSYKDALQALEEPRFDAGVDRIERLTEKIVAPAPTSVARKLRRGAEGDELDLARVWDGELDTAWTMARRTPVPKASRVLVVVRVNAMAFIKADVLAWRGVAALALADRLEAAGYVVRIAARRLADIRYVNRAYKGTHTVDVTVRKEGEPLDIHRAASLIASPLLFRGIMLPMTAFEAPARVSPSFSVTSSDGDDVEAPPGFDLVFVATDRVSDADSASAFVRHAVARLEAINTERDA